MVGGDGRGNRAVVTWDRPGIEEVEFEIVDSQRRQRREHANKVLVHRGVGQIEGGQLLTPIPPRFRPRHEPFRVFRGDSGVLTDEEGRDPDAGSAACSSDPRHQRAQICKPLRRLQPIADVALVTVVYLHHVDRQGTCIHRRQIVHDVGFGDVGEVLVPRAPHPRRWSHRTYAGASGELHCPGSKCCRNVVGAGGVLHHRTFGIE